MAQLISVRSNQNFGVEFKAGKLIPQTEIILLVEKPKYVTSKKGDKIERSTEVSELRFYCSTQGLNVLIGQLQAAERNAAHFEQMAGSLNEIIINCKAPEGEPVNP